MGWETIKDVLGLRTFRVKLTNPLTIHSTKAPSIRTPDTVIAPNGDKYSALVIYKNAVILSKWKDHSIIRLKPSEMDGWTMDLK